MYHIKYFYTPGISWPALTKISDSRAPPPPPDTPHHMVSTVQCLCRHPVWVQQPLGLVRTCWNVPSLSFTRIKIALIVSRENAAPSSDLTLPGQIIVYSLPGIRDYQGSCAAKQLEILLNLQIHNWFCSTKISPDIAY